MFFQNKILREILIRGYRVYGYVRPRLPGPPIFVNSMPKAGTHLVMKILTFLPETRLAGRHITRNDVRCSGILEPSDLDFSVEKSRFDAVLKKIRPGEIATAHMPWHSDLTQLLAEHGFATIYVTRDPRDVLVSMLHYIKHLKRHPLHNHIVNDYPDDASRYDILIRGKQASLNAPLVNSIIDRIRAFSKWEQSPNVLTVRFEDIIGQRGGGEAMRQRTAISDIARHINRPLSEKKLDEVIRKVANSSSFTFRKGLIGEGKKSLNQQHLMQLEEVLSPPYKVDKLP